MSEQTKKETVERRFIHRNDDYKAPCYMESAKVEAFIADILAVYVKHGMSISHEDEHGSFIIDHQDEDNEEWLKAAGVSKASVDPEAQLFERRKPYPGEPGYMQEVIQ